LNNLCNKLGIQFSNLITQERDLKAFHEQQRQELKQVKVDKRGTSKQKQDEKLAAQAEEVCLKQLLTHDPVCL